MPKNLFCKCPEEACLTYKHLWNPKNSYTQDAREHCDDLWNDFRPLADADFLGDFPYHTHQRWFEMYLAISLIKVGLKIQRPKQGPDVLITNGGRKIWIEAVCPTAGEEGKPDSVPKPLNENRGEKIVPKYLPDNQIVLRLRSALKDKACKYKHYLACGIVNQDDVLVVAINVHDVHYAWLEMEALMMRALYGVGHLTVTVNTNTMEIVDCHHKQSKTITKNSGAQVDVEPFIDSTMSHIAAVLGSHSQMARFTQPRLGDDFILFPNLKSGTAWPEGSISLGTEWLVQEDNDELKWGKIMHYEQ